MLQRLLWRLRGNKERRVDLARRRRFDANVRAILFGMGSSAAMRFVDNERGKT